MYMQWDTVTEKELKRLYYDEKLGDEQISEIYGVTIGKVTYLRKKLGITIRNQILYEFEENGVNFMRNSMLKQSRELCNMRI